MLRILKNVEMLKNVDTKINFFLTKIFFFDDFKTFINNPYFYQHLLSSLLISHEMRRRELSHSRLSTLRNARSIRQESFQNGQPD